MLTDLHELGRRGVIRKQVQGPGDDVTAGSAALVVLWLLPFAEDLDGGEASDLQQAGEPGPIQFRRHTQGGSNFITNDLIYFKTFAMCASELQQFHAIHYVDSSERKLMRQRFVSL